MNDLTVARPMAKLSPVELRHSSKSGDAMTVTVAIEEITRRLKPASAEWLAGRVSVLLGHYYDPDEGEQETRLRAQDWINALDGIAGECVAAACREYIQQPTRRRPVPGEIRHRALELQRAYRDAIAAHESRAKRAPALMMTDEELEAEEAERRRRRQQVSAELRQRLPHVFQGLRSVPKGEDE